MRGPGKTRRFAKQPFVRDGVWKAGAFEGTMTFEQRNQEALLRAQLLRRAGFKARVVNGSGWTAVYTGGEKAPAKPKPKPRITTIPSMPTEVPVFPSVTIPPTGGRDKPKPPPMLITEGFCVKCAGKDKCDCPKPKKPKPPITAGGGAEATITTALTPRLRAEPSYFERLGFGVVYPSINLKPESTVTGANLAVGSDAIEFIESMTKQQGSQSFVSWLRNAGGAQEKKWKGSPHVPEIQGVLSGNTWPWTESPGGIARKTGVSKDATEFFIIEVDGRPAYWSPASGEGARLFQKMKAELRPKPERKLSSPPKGQRQRWRSPELERARSPDRRPAAARRRTDSERDSVRRGG
jgi:hypothetical protein